MTEPVEVTFDADTLKKFKAAYAEATLDGEQEFSFEGKVFNTAFAKYLIEYLEPVIEVLDRNPFVYGKQRVN